jgi:glucan phosphoethanolaminetransferase (alkaline phosphatase superfamily)
VVSHATNVDRYPTEFARFPVVRSPCSSAKHESSLSDELKLNLQNGYDNAIGFTDYVLDSLIKALEEESGARSALTFVPDHGENGAEALRLSFAHGVNTPDVLHVPMFMWLSPDWRSTFSDKAKLLASRQNAPFSTAYLFDTVIDLAGLQCTLVDAECSLASPSFKAGKRLVCSEGGGSYV